MESGDMASLKEVANDFGIPVSTESRVEIKEVTA